MAASKYKIKITPERTLGPLDFERVQQFVRKGRIKGTEPSSKEPYTQWQPFSSFPELAALLSQKIPPAQGQPGAESEAEAAPTLTIAADSLFPEAEKKEPPASNTSNIEFEMPTLLDIKVAKKLEHEDPDTEKTKIGISAESTKMLTIDRKELLIEEFTPIKIPTAAEKKAAEYTTSDGKRRILSKNTAALLAIALLIIAYFSSENNKSSEEIADLFPRAHRFPYIDVNPPPRLGNAPDPAAAQALVESAQALMAKENPSDYIRAIRQLYTAVGKNSDNYIARGLLASSYMRVIEIIPRDEILFETLKKLLLPKPPANNNSAEYASALAEFYTLLERFDQADEAIDSYIRIRPTNELYYQKALIESQKRSLETATTFASKTIPPEGIIGNPRHFLLYAKLLEKKGQKEAANEILKRLRKEHPWYGPAILFEAESKFHSADYKSTKNLLASIVNHPHILNRLELSDAFLLLAKNYDASNDSLHALRFVQAARENHPDFEASDDLLYRIKSKIPASKNTYSAILEARQNEKSKQFDGAIRLYLQARESDRDDPIPNLLLARLYEKNGQVFDAIDRYEKAIAASKPPVSAMIELTEIYIGRYDMEKAKVQIARIDELKARKDASQMLKAKILQKEGQKDLAKVSFKQALSLGSRLPRLYLLMGDLESERNNRELAEFYYAMALRYDPLNSDALLGIAFARFYLESPTRAINFLKDKLKEQSNSASIMTSLAAIYLSSGDHESGKTYLQDAIRLDPHYAMAFKLLGGLAKDEAQHQNDPTSKRKSLRYALASYEIYAKMAPNDPEVFKAIGDLYFQVRDLGAAAKNYSQVLALAPNYPGINLRMAMISENGGDVEQSILLINKEIKVNPRSDDAYVELGNIHKIRQEYAEATGAYRKASVINDQNIEALEGLGEVYALQSNLEDALSLFQRVIKVDPLYAKAYWEMGLIYQRQNNKPKAIQTFNNLLAISQDPQTQMQAKKKLRELTN